MACLQASRREVARDVALDRVRGGRGERSQGGEEEDEYRGECESSGRRTVRVLGGGVVARSGRGRVVNVDLVLVLREADLAVFRRRELEVDRAGGGLVDVLVVVV